ncbi:MAG: extracellular solute-binding protein, family 7 [Rhodobacteraceae bacterium HLUCCA24]|nr:MAG: extracellular solute-binding protein, family 7 [Rhodobacteraceae bacterium HLUCCA24]
MGQLINALGGKPVGMPPTEMAEGLQKGTLDGTFIDFGGAGIAFQLGPHLASSTEIGAYTSSFALVMNPDSYAELPEDLQQLIDESFAGRSAEIGKVWDDVDVAGRNALEEAGVNIIRMSAEEEARFRDIGDQVTQDYVTKIDGKDKPGSEVLAMLRALAEEVGPVGLGCR